MQNIAGEYARWSLTQRGTWWPEPGSPRLPHVAASQRPCLYSEVVFRSKTVKDWSAGVNASGSVLEPLKSWSPTALAEIGEWIFNATGDTEMMGDTVTQQNDRLLSCVWTSGSKSGSPKQRFALHSQTAGIFPGFSSVGHTQLPPHSSLCSVTMRPASGRLWGHHPKLAGM